MNSNDIKQIAQLLEPIQKELEKHGEMLEKHGKFLEKHSKMLKSLKKDQGTMLDMLDREQMDQRKRLQRVEKHLGISTSLS